MLPLIGELSARAPFCVIYWWDRYRSCPLRVSTYRRALYRFLDRRCSFMCSLCRIISGSLRNPRGGFPLGGRPS